MLKNLEAVVMDKRDRRLPRLPGSQARYVTRNTGIRKPAGRPEPDPAGWSCAQEQIARVQWHILRGDSRRDGVAARAGTLLSTNAFVLTGIALAIGASKRGPGTAMVAATSGTLAFVAFSVLNAFLAIVTIFNWNRQFPARGMPLYTFDYDADHGTFDEFRHRVTGSSPEAALDDALLELWNLGLQHRYLHRRLRSGFRSVSAAIAFMLITIAISID